MTSDRGYIESRIKIPRWKDTGTHPFPKPLRVWDTTSHIRSGNHFCLNPPILLGLSRTCHLCLRQWISGKNLRWQNTKVVSQTTRAMAWTSGTLFFKPQVKVSFSLQFTIFVANPSQQQLFSDKKSEISGVSQKILFVPKDFWSSLFKKPNLKSRKKSFKPR